MLSSEQLDQLEVIGTCFWNSEYRKGIALCQTHKGVSPIFTSIHARFFWLRSFISENEKEADEALRLLDEAQDHAHEVLKKKHRGPTTVQDQMLGLCCKAVIAECTLFEAVLKFRLEQYVRGVVAFRKSWKYYLDCLALIRPIEEELHWDYNHGDLESEHHPAHSADTPERRFFRQISSVAYTGAALFHYLIDLIPKHFRWIVEGLGFQADRELAMVEFRKSVSCKNSISGPTAMILLTSILVFWEEKKADAQQLLEEYAKSYPKGEPFTYLGGYLYRQFSNHEKSTELFETTMKSTEIEQLSLYSAAEIGFNYYLTRQWDRAISVLVRFTTESHVSGYKCFMYYVLGICYEMNGQNAEAIETMKKIPPLVRKGFSLDEFSGRRSHLFIETKGLNATERLIIETSCLFDSLKHADCVNFVHSLSLDKMTPNEKARIWFFEGSSYLKMTQWDQAEQALRKVLEIEGQVTVAEHWVLPFAHCTLAEVLIEKANYPEANIHLKHALSDYSKYEFESWLIARCKRAQERIKKHEAGG